MTTWWDGVRPHAVATVRAKAEIPGPNRGGRPQGSVKRLEGHVPPELEGLGPDELDQRNTRIWTMVLRQCQRLAGDHGGDVDWTEPLVKVKAWSDAGTPAARRRTAIRAAVAICHYTYGIPQARIADLVLREPHQVRDWLAASTRPEVQAVIQAWRAADDGPSLVGDVAEAAAIEVPGYVARALRGAASARGITVGELVAQLVGQL